MLYIIVAIISVLTGYLAARYKNKTSAAKLETLLKEENEKGWKVGFDSGWKAYGGDAGMIWTRYNELFPKK